MIDYSSKERRAKGAFSMSIAKEPFGSYKLQLTFLLAAAGPSFLEQRFCMRLTIISPKKIFLFSCFDTRQKRQQLHSTEDDTQAKI